MKKIAALVAIILISCNACSSKPSVSIALPTQTLEAQPTMSVSTQEHGPISATLTWQIQYTGKMDYGLNVDVYNLDLFDTSPAVITQLHERDIFVICYFSGGSFEDWRPDADQFPPETLGEALDNWPGETWLDIRRIDLLESVMVDRLDMAVQKGCDGVDPDNVDGYQNDTGFPLTATDQKAYNVFLSEKAHERGLLIGLKNDLDQAPELVSFFDWVLSEECFQYDECHLLAPFTRAAKPVFVIEYQLSPDEFCSQARKLNVNALQKNRELDAFRFSCN